MRAWSLAAVLDLGRERLSCFYLLLEAVFSVAAARPVRCAARAGYYAGEIEAAVPASVTGATRFHRARTSWATPSRHAGDRICCEVRKPYVDKPGPEAIH